MPTGLDKSRAAHDLRIGGGSLNIADIITRGTNPTDLDVNTPWQQGSGFLRLPRAEWPIKSAKDVSATARGVVYVQISEDLSLLQSLKSR